MHVQSNSFAYSIKVWPTSVAVAPVIYILIDSLLKQNTYSRFEDMLSEKILIYVVCVLLGSALSLLTWVLFFLIIKTITMFIYNAKEIKLITTVLGLLLTAGTFALVFPDIFDNHNEFFYLMVANCFCIGVGSLLYKLKIDLKQNFETLYNKYHFGFWYKFTMFA